MSAISDDELAEVMWRGISTPVHLGPDDWKKWDVAGFREALDAAGYVIVRKGEGAVADADQ